jgi:hypothetical protein
LDRRREGGWIVDVATMHLVRVAGVLHVLHLELEMRIMVVGTVHDSTEEEGAGCRRVMVVV